MRAFRRRLTQAVATARQTRSDACVSLVLDAIDHAELAAREDIIVSSRYGVVGGGCVHSVQITKEAPNGRAN